MLIAPFKTATMLALATAVSRGCYWHVSGTVSADRFPALEDKFARLYDTELSKALRSHRKRRGVAGARFLAHPAYRAPVFFWWLLLTDGEHPARSSEAVLDARVGRQRLAYSDEFELVRVPATGGTVRWTWRMTAARMERWREDIRVAIRQRRSDDAIVPVIMRYQRLPGFRGVRQQVAALRKYTAGEWTRTKGTLECPHLPKAMVPYVRHRAWPGVDSSLIVKRLREGLPPFSVEMILDRASPVERNEMEAEPQWGDVLNAG